MPCDYQAPQGLGHLGQRTGRSLHLDFQYRKAL